MPSKCRMILQGYERGSCGVIMPDGSIKRACEATLREENGPYYRLIEAIQLSRLKIIFQFIKAAVIMNV